jgi:branched-chain amino acid transport system substrate-binding protein
MSTWLRRAAALTAVAVAAAGCGGRDEGDSEGGRASSPGITEESIKLGGTFARSGPVAAAGQAADGGQAAILKLNANGGIDGRKLELVVEDDQYDPTVALSKSRKLVDQDQVFALWGSVGTAAQLSARTFFDQKKVPALFLYTGARAWGSEHDKYPYSMTGVASYYTIGKVYGEYLKKEKPDAKVGILFQNDDLGLDHIAGFKDAIKGSNVKIVREVGYEITTPTTAPLVSRVARSGADVFFNIGSPQPASQALEAVNTLDWKPLVLLPATGVEPKLLKGAGAAAEGAISEAWWKDPANPEYKDDPDVQEYLKYMEEEPSDTDANGRIPVTGYINMHMMAEALKNMKSPTRDALLEAAGNLDAEIPMLLPGIKAQTGPGDPLPIETLQLQEFDGERWSPIGDPIDTSGGSAG